MEDILLLLIIISFGIAGYYIMKKVDLFIWNCEKSRSGFVNHLPEKQVLKKCSGEDITLDKSRK